MWQTLRLRLCDSILCWFPQSASFLRLVPSLQQTRQGREKFLLQIVRAATVYVVPGDSRKGVVGSDDRLLAGVGIGGQREHIDHFPIVPPVVPGADSPARRRCTSYVFFCP